MKILWFRRDLRVTDNPLLSFGGEVMPIFIFDRNILDGLDKDDKRVSFIYEQVMQLKKDLQTIGLDLYIFYGTPEEVFSKLLQLKPQKVIASIDFDGYAKKRDAEIAKMLEFERLDDSYIFGVNEIIKEDHTPYLVFTPYFKKAMQLYTPAHALKHELKSHTLFQYKQRNITLKQMGFDKQNAAVEPPFK